MAAIEFRPASREKIGLLLSCIGGTGSGKTLSGLLLARGLCNGDDSKIAVIDTEAGRALHYAPAVGQKPGALTFGFRHADMKPPFTPEAYAEAIEAAEAAGFWAIMIDSFSHEYAGDGGLDDIHEAELDRIAGDDDGKRERLSIMAWKVPKKRHKRLVSRMLQCRAHLIICMRAEERMKITKVQAGEFKKTVITAAEDRPMIERWEPSCEKRFPFEITGSLLFVASKPGVPIPIKLEAQHREFIPLDRPLSSECGVKLGEWARGGVPAAGGPPGPVTRDNTLSLPAAWDTWSLEERGENRANAGTTALKEWWTTLPKADRDALASKLEGWKKTAQEINP